MIDVECYDKKRWADASFPWSWQNEKNDKSIFFPPAKY